MLSLILAATVSARINIEVDIGRLVHHYMNRRETKARVTCGIRTVGYRWTGAPGTEVRYLGRAYVIGADGQLELIAGREVPKGADTMRDQFGFRDVVR